MKLKILYNFDTKRLDVPSVAHIPLYIMPLLEIGEDEIRERYLIYEG